MPSQDATDQFLNVHFEIGKLLNTLKQYHSNHLDVNPDTLDWSDVGNANHVKEMLEQVVNFIEGKE